MRWGIDVAFLQFHGCPSAPGVCQIATQQALPLMRAAASPIKSKASANSNQGGVRHAA